MSDAIRNVPLPADWATNIWNGMGRGEQFSLLVVIIGCGTGIICMLIVFVAGTIKSTQQRRLETEMKREMLDRGMSADDIAKVISCTTPNEYLANR